MGLQHLGKVKGSALDMGQKRKRKENEENGTVLFIMITFDSEDMPLFPLRNGEFLTLDWPRSASDITSLSRRTLSAEFLDTSYP